MPGRIKAADLPAKLRVQLVGRAARPAPVRTRPTSQPEPAPPGRFVCVTCGLRERYEAPMLRHCTDTRHYRYTDLGLGL